MLINCNQGCKLKNGTTTGVLDLESNEVVCSFCSDVIKNISSFAKTNMKLNGIVKKPNTKKAFAFNCKTCKKSVETYVEDGKPRGKNCDLECSFDISKFAIRAMSTITIVNIEEETNARKNDETEDV